MSNPTPNTSTQLLMSKVVSSHFNPEGLFLLQLLWSFCSSQLEDGETKPFKLTHAIPGATKSLDYDTQISFEESGLANSMISVTWD